MDRVAACKVYHGDAYKDQDPLAYYESSNDASAASQKDEAHAGISSAYACGAGGRENFPLHTQKNFKTVTVLFLSHRIWYERKRR